MSGHTPSREAPPVVVVVGLDGPEAGAGIALDAARWAAKVVLVGSDPGRLGELAAEIEALRTAPVAVVVTASPPSGRDLAAVREMVAELA